MINLNFNPKLNFPNAVQKNDVKKNEYASASLKLRAPLAKDTISFTAMNRGKVSDMSYKNVLGKQLTSEERPTFSTDLQSMNLESYSDAKVRISSLSRYLKEDMVGFVVPEYETNGEKKGGYQWFEQGAEYLLRGSKENAKEQDFKPIAKELYGLLAVHDNYWKSPEFAGYLSTLKQTPAIKATIAAVNELDNEKEVSFTGGKVVSMFGYFSPMKAMDRLLNDGCAYSGKSMQFDDPTYKHAKISPEVNASLEHIMPKSWGGPCDDANYLVVSQQANTKRGNMNLIKYLRGGKD